jgi:hypothetical protein
MHSCRLATASDAFPKWKTRSHLKPLLLHKTITRICSGYKPAYSFFAILITAKSASADAPALSASWSCRGGLLLANGADWRRFSGGQRGKNGGGASPGEGGLAGGHFINHGAQGEKVGACVERLALRLFR